MAQSLCNTQTSQLRYCVRPTSPFCLVCTGNKKRPNYPPGDTLFFYTDDISEAEDKGQAEFGEERLIAAVGQNGHSAQAIQTRVITAVQQIVILKLGQEGI